ncbi:hypothetical protein FS837_001073 [Tulasnella sp. UAMH 9824]|nr:hypothetical protein FS837_001073 [Tulasnella sp. UAMH 9824]
MRLGAFSNDMASKDPVSQELSQRHCPVYKVPTKQSPTAQDNEAKAGGTLTANPGGRAAAAKRGSVMVSKVPLRQKASKVEAGNHIRRAGVAGLAWQYLEPLWKTAFSSA